MKKQIWALAAVAALAFPLAACSSDSASDTSTAASDTTTAVTEEESATEDESAAADVIGINELPVGDSGPQTNGPLTVDAVYFQAVDMEHGTIGIKPF